MIHFGSDPANTMHLILGTNELTFTMHITAWVLALLTIPIHVAVVKFIPSENFKRCLALDLENNDDDSNCLTARMTTFSDGYRKLSNGTQDDNTAA